VLNMLMDISEVEAGAVKLEVEEVNVLALMNQVCELYRCVAEDKNIVMAIECPEGLYMFVDRNRLRQVIANLLDNALKYSRAGGDVKLAAAYQGSEIVITITDSGIGIEREDLARIWDRFYRGDKSRTQRGLGLGLSLVKAMIEAHKGKIEVSSEPGRGSCFLISLPFDHTPALPEQLS